MLSLIIQCFKPLLILLVFSSINSGMFIINKSLQSLKLGSILSRYISASKFDSIHQRTPRSSTDAYIAIGSNLGDRYRNFHKAVQSLSYLGKVKATSFLYETQPMYHADQPIFLNAVVLLNTCMAPDELLSELKAIEALIGRTETFRNGPRVIDLDVILYGDRIVESSILQIPHPRLHEREFVLRPLCDISSDLIHPTKGRSVGQLLSDLPSSTSETIYSVIPLGKDHINSSSKPVHLQRLGSKVLIAGILNATPDSFSDGGLYMDVNKAVAHAEAMICDGADIIDIGGESTRPESLAVDPDEELRRVLPIIAAIRSKQIPICISIDTRNARVAAAAIEAGANVINDVSGGQHDPDMLRVAALHGVPIVLMHMRGTPQTMTSTKCTTYSSPLGSLSSDSTAVVDSVIDELAATLNSLEGSTSLSHIAGVNDSLVLPRWLQIVDPGIGFAKNFSHNLELLKPSNLMRLKSQLGNRPLFVGASRKRFIKTILESSFGASDATSAGGESLVDKDYGTTGASCAAVMGGADIIRVHNVRAARAACDVLKRILE